MTSNSVSLPVRLAIAVAIVANLSPAVRADARIVAKMNVTGIADPGQSVRYPRNTTAYEHGDKAVVIVDGGDTIVYDGAARTVTTENQALRTYSVQTWDETMAQGGPMGRAAERLNMNAKVDLKRTGETRTMAGGSASRYSVTGSLTMSPKRNTSERRGGMGRGRGGGFPGGGRGRFPGMPYQRGGYYLMALPKVSLAGEVWLADAPTAPVAGKDKQAALAMAELLMPPNPLMKPLSERLTRLRAFPVAGNLSLTVTPSNGGPPTVITATMEASSIGEGTVENGAFDVPADYRRADPPTAEPLFALPEGRFSPGEAR